MNTGLEWVNQKLHDPLAKNMGKIKSQKNVKEKSLGYEGMEN